MHRRYSFKTSPVPLALHQLKELRRIHFSATVGLHFGISAFLWECATVSVGFALELGESPVWYRSRTT